MLHRLSGSTSYLLTQIFISVRSTKINQLRTYPSVLSIPYTSFLKYNFYPEIYPSPYSEIPHHVFTLQL